MQHPNWSTFKKGIPVKASVATVMNAWRIPSQIESWFLKSAEYTSQDDQPRDPAQAVRAGDRYAWQWFGYADYTEHGKVLTSNEELFQFTFADNCTVSVRCIEEMGYTICKLTQENIPLTDDPAENLHVRCGEGWTFYLANLKSILEGGIDLRNKIDELRGVINS